MMRATKPKLLVIEDDEGLQRQLKWAFEEWEVLCAGNRSEAIALLRSDEPQVATLDLGLPPDPDGVSEGLATLSEMLHLKPDLKVIVASGHGERSSAQRAIAMKRQAAAASNPVPSTFQFKRSFDHAIA